MLLKQQKLKVKQLHRCLSTLCDETDSVSGAEGKGSGVRPAPFHHVGRLLGQAR